MSIRAPFIYYFSGEAKGNRWRDHTNATGTLTHTSNEFGYQYMQVARFASPAPRECRAGISRWWAGNRLPFYARSSRTIPRVRKQRCGLNPTRY